MHENTSSNQSLAARFEELERQIRQTDQEWERARAVLREAGDVELRVESLPEPINPVVDPPTGLRA